MAAALRKRRARTRDVRWDRIGRIGLLVTLGVILLLYVSPTRHWLEQSGTHRAQKQELRELKAENARLKRRVRALRDPAALEQAARRLGMVRKGERSYVIENPAAN
jgi:cell division protein FtsB